MACSQFIDQSLVVYCSMTLRGQLSCDARGTAAVTDGTFQVPAPMWQ